MCVCSTKNVGLLCIVVSPCLSEITCINKGLVKPKNVEVLEIQLATSLHRRMAATSTCVLLCALISEAGYCVSHLALFYLRFYAISETK